MSDLTEFYKTPNAMEPLFPDDASKKLEALAITLISKANNLSGKLHPITRAAIADFLRPMNSYYSNLIEGHDTHPIDIHKALNSDYSKDKKKRDLQLEAYAHVNVHKSISEEMRKASRDVNPSSVSFLQRIHSEFYDYLPSEFKKVISKEGEVKEVIPGKFRKTEVEVGRHIAPYSKNLKIFMERFENFYDSFSDSNQSKIKRIISIAASHHRLVWIHPFLDGNGRVVRLYSDACFMFEELDASGLWSISRGLARAKEDYHAHLANADLQRFNDYDGRGNLSNKILIAFCDFFIQTAIDQIDYMSRIIDIDTMLTRLTKFAELMSIKGKLKRESEYVLTGVFLKGKISKSEAMRITQLSDKTLKILIDELTALQLLIPKKEGKEVMYYVSYPITYAASIFPGLYPSSKEIDMLNEM
ncbi:MAG: Fic family protein [Crocinitomicaceae bacterium]|nr:Fic family protein [Crocinitomicaceae bacterium]